MKKLLLNILFEISTVCFLGCDKNIVTQDTSIIIDITEPDLAKPSINDIRKKSSLAGNLNNGQQIRLLTITETGFNTVHDFTIDKVPVSLFGNSYEREADTAQYFSNISEALVSLDTAGIKQQGSVIFKVVSEELNRLAYSSADIRSMILSTDGYENSELSNFYSPKTMALLKINPESIYSQYLSIYPLEDLTGIVIYLIYQPINRADSERFEIISNFYTQLFESCNATVIVSGSL